MVSTSPVGTDESAFSVLLDASSPTVLREFASGPAALSNWAAAAMVASTANDVVVAPAPAPTLEDVLSLPQVQMKNPERTLAKIRKFVADGAQNLLVISDFDHTLSRAYDDKGTACWTTHGVFDNEGHLLSKELGAKLVALRNKYYPIEFHETMSIKEKIPHMEEWWRASHQYIVDTNVTREVMASFVRDSYIRFRDDTAMLLESLSAAHVPLILFSAGIGDIISIFLQQQLGHVPSNIHLISNMMTYDEKNAVSGFTSPLIHTYNKNGSVIPKENGFFHECSRRNNVILMGDSMGDLHMDVGVENHRHEDTLKIGFLNKRPNLLPHYLDGYDLVLVDDQSMAVPNALVAAITAAARP